jgi:leucyl/phenylalanyl-tRNA---protein transferase
MDLFELSDDLAFPHPDFADEQGLVAYGGDLRIARLLLAYSKGIFPWPVPEYPLLWWSPDPRVILPPDKMKISKSLRLLVQKNKYVVTTDTCFREVISACQQVKRKDEGTWILDEIIEAFCQLHEFGAAHSVETFYEGKLVGGLYGVSLGGMFVGESMFHTMADASKIAVYHLCKWAKTLRVEYIDGQIPSNHLSSLGFTEISRKDYLEMLDVCLNEDLDLCKWDKKSPD